MKKKAEWEYIEPRRGSQIRVERAHYYHHGIYIGDGRVIHFGEGDAADFADADSAVIRETSLAEFLKGGYCEVRVYSGKEKRKLLEPDEIVSKARAKLGESGYDIENNNCEHFSNECAFGVKDPSRSKKMTQKAGK